MGLLRANGAPVRQLLLLVFEPSELADPADVDEEERPRQDSEEEEVGEEVSGGEGEEEGAEERSRQDPLLGPQIGAVVAM